MSNYFHAFNTSLKDYELPEKFDYPFYYEPKPIAKLACKEVIEYLENQKDFIHNFGKSCTNENQSLPIGKMFGVLVVKNKDNEIGFLAAVSGKLANTNTHKYFVPPVFDMLKKEGFFLEQEERLNEINRLIEELESDSNYLTKRKNFDRFLEEEKEIIQKAKIKFKNNKKDRKLIREKNINILSKEEFVLLEDDLIKQSLRDKHLYRLLINDLDEKRKKLFSEVNYYEIKLEKLKEERKIKSGSLQNQLFNQYQFLNQYNEKKGLLEIFSNTAFKQPPAAAGECAAPKLLQYAFLNNFTPICMAEFWWGDSPKSEVRKHGQFYPACTGKCEPILGHMLKDIALEDNPLIKPSDKKKKIEIIYKDDFLVVINKPEELLSVPGINITESVFSTIKSQFPKAVGPIIVHRLDMSTSGLMVIALDKETHKHLQQQFIKRTVKKYYLALLDGIVETDFGTIELPLRVDLNDRPRQVVCYIYGKPAKTEYEVIDRQDGRTLIKFFPITGRTHQLRMHASHHLGLNTPILGDDLYGKKNKRLFLHAQYLEFIHPKTKETLKFELEPNFNI